MREQGGEAERERETPKQASCGSSAFVSQTLLLLFLSHDY